MTNVSAVAIVRKTVLAMLAERGHGGPVSDHDSLFFSGKLDSMAATEVLMLLEREIGIDLADADFDITQLDTLAQIEGLIGGRA
ncbi:acyl carrier protein [Bosea sp. (in: a-proteobacteria)]|uniref:acyl carrier protein n=1 Tax=Bosea sp. (in: a-proteobacteria) TaxID=1871050 RepID=UPI002FC9A78A